MPNRILKESICTSEEINALSFEEEVFFYRLLVNCDDFGRFDARPAILRARLFPLRLEQVTEDDVKRWLRALVRVGLVYLYEVDGKQYVQVIHWDKHQQKRAKHSKFPPPPEPHEGMCNHMISDDIICNHMQADDSNVTASDSTCNQMQASQRNNLATSTQSTNQNDVTVNSCNHMISNDIICNQMQSDDSICPRESRIENTRIENREYILYNSKVAGKNMQAMSSQTDSHTNVTETQHTQDNGSANALLISHTRDQPPSQLDSNQELDDNEPGNGSTPPQKPRVPYKQIVELYHAECPDLPRVRVLTDLRRKLIAARWREHPDIEFWRSYFRRVHDSDFLCGRVEPRGGRPPFRADLEWLMRPNNFAKVIEGKYDNPPDDLDQILKEFGGRRVRR